MLRTLLSVFGVVFIGLGLFGGPLLEQVQQRLTGSPIAVAQISNEQIGNASQKPAVIAVEAPTQVAVQEETATQVLAPEVAPQVLAQATNHSTTPASGELQPAVQVQTSQATVNSISNELSVETKVIPAVAMQKPADEIMSRNEQLAILDKAITSTSVESQIAAQAPVQPTIQEKAVSKVTEQVNSEAPASPALGCKKARSLWNLSVRGVGCMLVRMVPLARSVGCISV